MKDLSPATIHSGDVTVNKNLTFGAVSERFNLVTTAYSSGANPIACGESQVVYYNTAFAETDMIFNFVGGAPDITLQSIMAVGEVKTITLLITTGAVAYKPVGAQIDGITVIPKWAGGSMPSAGNANSIDSYTYSILKTDSTFLVLASQTQYK